tara:strand:+ start:463 stop:660 length:198 start_codon:yes stop_codon:yes gene_type:complete
MYSLIAIKKIAYEKISGLAKILMEYKKPKVKKDTIDKETKKSHLNFNSKLNIKTEHIAKLTPLMI